MKNKIKIFLAALFVSIIIPSFSVYAEEYDIPNYTNFYVNDFANIIPPAQELAIIQKAQSLSDKRAGTQICITTIETTNGIDVSEYSTKMYNEYGIGKDNKGVLILYVMENNKLILKVGSGFKNVITDDDVNNLISEYAIDYFAENNFSEGIMNLFNGTYDFVDNYYINGGEVLISSENDENNIEKKYLLRNFSIFFYIIFTISIIFSIVFFNFEKKKGKA